jgi:peptidyl-tRNA hydrolase, PTH1 family
MFTSESKKFLICGLGNIGEEYANTRHNVGFLVLEALAMDLKVNYSPGRLASIAKTRFKGKSLLLVKPNTYVNLSGKALKYWMTAEDIPLENLLVIVDDIALPLGTLRMKKKGGDAGHNGLNNIIMNLNTEDFPRLRIGIGNDFAKGYQVDYVLGKWTKAEETIMIEKINKAVEAIKSFIFEGADKAMNQFNN